MSILLSFVLAVQAGDLVPGLLDSQAAIDLTTRQAGSVDDIAPIDGTGQVTLAVRFNPAPADLTAGGPVILIECGGTSFGNGLYLSGGNLIFATKGSNGGNGNGYTQNGLNDTDVSDSAAAVIVGTVTAGEDIVAWASYDTVNGILRTSLKGELKTFTITGTSASANLSGDKSVSFLGTGSITSGQLGGLTNALLGQNALWDANMASNFTGTAGSNPRGQIFAALAPEILPSFSITVTETTGFTAVSESGLADEISIAVTDDPQDYPVTVELGASDNTQLSFFPSSLVFNTANWQTPQTITITAVDDSIRESYVHSVSVLFSVIVETASSYSGTSIEDIAVAITENDCGAWVGNPADLNRDCQIDLIDFTLLVQQWLRCTMPESNCDDMRP